MIILCMILISIAAYCEAVMDTLAHHFEKSIFAKLNSKWWNPVVSGNNKWKNGDKSQGERFFLSSTLLVGFTEAWHLFKMIRTFCVFLAMATLEYQFLKSIYISISARILFGTGFTLFYKILKTK